MLIKNNIMNRRQVMRGMLHGGAVSISLPFLNAFLNENASNLRLAPQRTRVVWQFVGVGELLRPIVWSAADLLMGSRVARIHQCPIVRCDP